MSSDDKQEMVSRDFMRVQIAVAEVQTSLRNHQTDFAEQAKKNDATFNDIYRLLRKLKTEVTEEMDKNFVSQTEFKVFTTKIIYAIVGGIAVAGFIQWVLSTFISVGKVIGN